MLPRKRIADLGRPWETGEDSASLVVVDNCTYRIRDDLADGSTTQQDLLKFRTLDAAAVLRCCAATRSMGKRAFDISKSPWANGTRRMTRISIDIRLGKDAEDERFPRNEAPNPLQSHHHVRGSSDVPSMIVQLDGVREKFPEWFAEFDKGQPLYCLPASAIRILSSGNKRGKRFIDVSHAAAEYAFQSVCDAVNAIGFWSSKPISYPVLSSTRKFD